MQAISCLLLLAVLAIMLGWAFGVGLLLRNGHYLLAVPLGIAWPIGLNFVLGAAIFVGQKLTRGRQ